MVENAKNSSETPIGPFCFQPPRMLCPKYSEGNFLCAALDNNLPDCYMLYYTNVENAAGIKAAIKEGEGNPKSLFPQCCVLDASNVLSTAQVLGACLTSLLADHNGSRKTNSVYTEILYNMSTGTHVKYCSVI